jgi:beta-N-acetylhexosaminidase
MGQVSAVRERKRDRFIEQRLREMTLEQKVGCCFVMDFMGTVITPYTRRLIEDFHVSGLRVNTTFRGKPSYVDKPDSAEARRYLRQTYRAPVGHVKDYTWFRAPHVSPQSYARTLNELRDMATSRPGGLPLHITLDQEGNGTENYGVGDVRLLPPAMGLAASGSPKLVEEAAEAVAMQLRAGGVNWVHAPVLDVNSNPLNPEIGVRSFGDTAAKVTRYALATLRGYQKHNLIATAKHFPGRGESEVDSHLVCPEVTLSHDELMRTHIHPYRTLIEAGLPAIMIAHTSYPALDPSGEPATTSKRIVTGLLREELGFDGVVTTDNLFMRGLITRHGLAEATIRALLAGQDLLLFRNEDTMAEEVFNKVVNAVRKGRIPLSRIEEANRRVLRLKYDYGLFKDGGKVKPEKAAEPQQSPFVIETEKKAARRAVNVRDDVGLLPLKKSTRVLLVENVHTTHSYLNNERCHPQIFWELLQDMAPSVYGVEITEDTPETRKRIRRRLPEADVVVVTSWLAHRSGSRTVKLCEWLKRRGLPVVVVTDSPYPIFGIDQDAPTIINIYSGNPESLRVAGEFIFGKRKASGRMPIEPPERGLRRSRSEGSGNGGDPATSAWNGNA